MNRVNIYINYYTTYTDGQKVFVPVNSVTSGNLHSVTSGAVFNCFNPVGTYGYIEKQKVNRMAINVGTRTMINADLLNQYLGQRLGGGLTIVDIDGTYENVATLICNCVTGYGTNNVYGMCISLSFYSGFQKYRLNNGTWSEV